MSMSDVGQLFCQTSIGDKRSDTTILLDQLSRLDCERSIIQGGTFSNMSGEVGVSNELDRFALLEIQRSELLETSMVTKSKRT